MSNETHKHRHTQRYIPLSVQPLRCYTSLCFPVAQLPQQGGLCLSVCSKSPIPVCLSVCLPVWSSREFVWALYQLMGNLPGPLHLSRMWVFVLPKWRKSPSSFHVFFLQRSVWKYPVIGSGLGVNSESICWFIVVFTALPWYVWFGYESWFQNYFILPPFFNGHVMLRS